jgi:hypothetical protein
MRHLSPISASRDEFDENEFDRDNSMVFSSTDDHRCDRYKATFPNFHPFYEKSKIDNRIGGTKEIVLPGFQKALSPPPPPPPEKDRRYSSQHTPPRLPRRTEAPPPPPPEKDRRFSSRQHSSPRLPRRTEAPPPPPPSADLRFLSDHSSPRQTFAPPPRFSSPRLPRRTSSISENDDAVILLEDSDALQPQVTPRGSLMRQKCVGNLNTFTRASSDCYGMNKSQRSMQSESQFSRAASCHDVFCSARPSRVPPRRCAPSRQSKNESELLKCLARAASERNLDDESASSISRQYQSARHLGRTQSRLHVIKDGTADKAQLSLSTHFPSVAMCMQSGHRYTDADCLPRQPMSSRQYQSARHLGRTQSRLHVTEDDTADEAKLPLSSHFPSVATCMQSGHGYTDADCLPRQPMSSRQYQSARHLRRTQSRLHVIKDDTADEAKLSLSSHFPSVAICMQSGTGDTDEDLSPRCPMRTQSTRVRNSKHSSISPSRSYSADA